MAIAQYVCDVDSWCIYIDMPQPVAWCMSLYKVVSRLDSLCISHVCGIIINKISDSYRWYFSQCINCSKAIQSQKICNILVWLCLYHSTFFFLGRTLC